jgi:hypothetical protein
MRTPQDTGASDRAEREVADGQNSVLTATLGFLGLIVA